MPCDGSALHGTPLDGAPLRPAPLRRAPARPTCARAAGHRRRPAEPALAGIPAGDVHAHGRADRRALLHGRAQVTGPDPAASGGARRGARVALNAREPTAAADGSSRAADAAQGSSASVAGAGGPAGGRRCRVACSNAKASAINRGPLNGGPEKVTPDGNGWTTGSAAGRNPPGTTMLG